MNVYPENEYDIIHETSVDFVSRPVAREVHIVQNDKGLPIIKVNLFSNGRRYTIPQDITVKIRFGMHNKVEVYQDILGSNQERNAIYFSIAEAMTVYDGRFIAVVELIFSANKKGSSSPIGIIIDKDPMSII